MDSEFQRELALLQQDGLKTNPMRLAYEEKVRGLQALKEELAHRLHTQRRELGRAYKEMAPPLFRFYIYYATEQEYGDPLGPDYEQLRKRKTPRGDHRLRHPSHCGFRSAADLGRVHPVV